MSRIVLGAVCAIVLCLSWSTEADAGKCRRQAKAACKAACKCAKCSCGAGCRCR